MKILFLVPSWTDDFGILSRLAHLKYSQPPLGPLYLAGLARDAGHEVRFHDGDAEGFRPEELAPQMVAEGYDLVALSATSPVVHKALHFARLFKALSPATPIVLGGEHCNIFKDQALAPELDYVFHGEVAHNFIEFLTALQGNRDVSGIRGLCYWNNGIPVLNPALEAPNDLDHLPFPAMDILNLDNYQMYFARYPKRRFLPMLASMGCPFQCVFCSEPLTSPKLRFRSPRNIFDEMKKWSTELGVHHFAFVDSNLTLNRKQILELCDLIIDSGLPLTFEGWTRANLVTRDLLVTMRKAGLIRLSFGIESGDPEVLDLIQKRVSLDEMLTAFRWCGEIGIEPMCSVMLGLPGESRASILRTIRFVRGIPELLYTNFSIANPYPGTVLLEWAREGKHGLRLLSEDLSQFARYEKLPTMAVNELQPADLLRLQKFGLVWIHFTPKRMWYIWRKIGFSMAFLLFVNLLKSLVFRGGKAR
jgi:radical SAM superfamily enzyme YgiQ (UPF0313 family)